MTAPWVFAWMFDPIWAIQWSWFSNFYGANMLVYTDKSQHIKTHPIESELPAYA
jgi:hypothetical protein